MTASTPLPLLLVLALGSNVGDKAAIKASNHNIGACLSLFRSPIRSPGSARCGGTNRKSRLLHCSGLPLPAGANPVTRCCPSWWKNPGSTREIRFVVVDVDDEVEGRDRLVEALDLKIPVLWDEGHEIAERLRPEGMPATFVLDGEGQVLYQHSGSKDEDWHEFTRFISTLDLN